MCLCVRTIRDFPLGEFRRRKFGARDEDKMAEESKPVTAPVPKPRPRKGTKSVSTESVETSSSPTAASRRRNATSESSGGGKSCLENAEVARCVFAARGAFL